MIPTTITVRHSEIPDALRAHALTVVDRISTFAKRPLEAHVVFDVDGTSATAELRLHVSHGDVFVATGQAPDHRTALDRAEAKLRRQLERTVGRLRQARQSAPMSRTLL